MAGRHSPEKMFAKLDADGNGTLSAEEFAKARKGGKHGHDRKHAGKHDRKHGGKHDGYGKRHGHDDEMSE